MKKSFVSVFIFKLRRDLCFFNGQISKSCTCLRSYLWVCLAFNGQCLPLILIFDKLMCRVCVCVCVCVGREWSPCRLCLKKTAGCGWRPWMGENRYVTTVTSLFSGERERMRATICRLIKKLSSDIKTAALTSAAGVSRWVWREHNVFPSVPNMNLFLFLFFYHYIRDNTCIRDL